MRTHSPLVVDVHEVLENPGARRPLWLQARVEGLDVGLVGVPDDLRLDLILEAMDAGVLVQGSVSGTFAGSCGRCLTDITRPFNVRVAEVYRPPSEVWEEGYVVTHASIDLERMVRDAVGLEIPVNPLCKVDCAGLCPKCGADRNTNPCDCPAEVTDLRWSALKDLNL